VRTWAKRIRLAAGVAAIWATPATAIESVWARLPAGLPADSMAAPLHRIEATGPRPTAAGAAYALGQFHMARGEYPLAAAAFGRAAARLEGHDRGEARYRQGVAFLGEREPGKARAAFEEVAMLSQTLRALAQLGLAQSFVLAGERERAIDVLRRLLDGPAAEAEPAALARYAALCERAHREADVAAARARLARRWPRSFEAALLPPPPQAGKPAGAP